MEPRPPRERDETLRQLILKSLEQGYPLTSRDISQEVRASEREVMAHLEHIRISLRSRGRTLAVNLPECRKCGYVFKGRTRLTKPGRCPECNSTSISPPEFYINNQ